MRNSLSSLFGIQLHDVVSIVGSGGKSTLMNCLAADLAHVEKSENFENISARVLMTTSTKILAPQPESYCAFLDETLAERVIEQKNHSVALSTGVYLAGKKSLVDRNKNNFDKKDDLFSENVKQWNSTDGGFKKTNTDTFNKASILPRALADAVSQVTRSENSLLETQKGTLRKREFTAQDESLRLDEYKITSFSPDMLGRLTSFFDYTLIEADGSKMLPLKGWASHEPVVLSCTTLTVGVLPVFPLGRSLDETLAHRLDAFCRLVHINPGEMLQPEHLARVISNPEGLFAKAVGRRIVFLSQIETDDSLHAARSVAAALKQQTHESFMIIAGSAQKNSGVIVMS